jgi:hypothetical protein
VRAEPVGSAGDVRVVQFEWDEIKAACPWNEILLERADPDQAAGRRIEARLRAAREPENTLNEVVRLASRPGLKG